MKKHARWFVGFALFVCCGLATESAYTQQECKNTPVGHPQDGGFLVTGSRCQDAPGTACTGYYISMKGTCQQSPKDCSAGTDGCYCMCVEPEKTAAPAPVLVKPSDLPKPTPPPTPPPTKKDGGGSLLSLAVFFTLAAGWMAARRLRA